mmetsp:Transcript_6276/g.7951  ORF Transcript_6276/g.7951 Transcript_6276/m.7951 type:complete len:244 (-) Transcript_6276:38-769(-)
MHYSLVNTCIFMVLVLVLIDPANTCNAFTVHISNTRRYKPSPSSLLLSSESSSRRRLIIKSIIVPITASSILIQNAPNRNHASIANAAPPIAIIAEELGYFPVTNREGVTKYVPSKVKRKSTDQSIELATHLKNIGACMYGTYWCGHTSHQKELFGLQAWSIINYVECSPKGAYYDAQKINLVANKIDGFPTWYLPNKSNGKKKKEEWISGEMPLERIAVLSGFKDNFDVTLEGPDAGITGSC